MRKRLLGLLFIAPLTASCSGFPISKDEALKIIGTLESSVESVSSTSYTSTRVTTNGDNVVTVNSVYSKEKKFFHTYTIRAESVSRVEESWRFVMNYEYEIETETGKSTESKDFIFEVTRKISTGKVNPDDGSNFDVVYDDYTKENWEKYAKEYEGTLKRAFSDALDSSKTLLNDKNNDIELKSLNGTSLYLDSKISTVGTTTQKTEYELEVSNGQLMYIKDTKSETSSTELTYKYSIGDVVYPSFKTKIRI